MDRKERIEKLIKQVREQWIELRKEDASQYIYLHQLPAAKELEEMGCELIDVAWQNYYGDVAAIVCPYEGVIYAFASNLGDIPIEDSIIVYRIKVEERIGTNDYIRADIPGWLFRSNWI